MKVKELKKKIQNLPDDMEVLVSNKYDGTLRRCYKNGVDFYFTDGDTYALYKDEEFDKKEKCYVLGVM